MTLYCGIDLHSNNHVVVIIDEQDRRILEQKLANDLSVTLKVLEPFRTELAGVAVESTFNWYWLVDGLQEAGYALHLVNTGAVQQYSGLKYSDDRHDAFWLAHLMRLGILPTGYIYPKAPRAVRDLLRRRMQLVQIRALLLISLQSQIWRETGVKVPTARLKRNDLRVELHNPQVALAAASYQTLHQSVQLEVERLEKAAMDVVSSSAEIVLLQTIKGVGPVLALVILLETGAIQRFAKAGHYASYCRCVRSEKLSNGKAGNKYLSWAFSEAAHFAVRFDPKAKRFYERKRRKTNGIVAIRAVAHKLARAVFYMLRDQVSFDADKLFA